MQLTKIFALGAVLSLAAAACADGDGSNDPDARPSFDAASDTPDAAAGDPDAASSPDAMPEFDAPPPTPSEQIQMARDAADGTVSIALEGVYVTYVKPAVGSDVAGFFVQHEQAGPALFIAVDPASLTPTPAVGDEIELTVTEMGTAGMARQATAVSGVSVVSSSNDLSGLVQDLSAATDVVSAIGSYEHEMVTLTGTVADDFGSAGTDHVQATITTTGVTADTNLKLRVPAALADTLDLANTCTFTVGPTPMWRFNTTAQPSAWVAGDIAIATCPEPTVVSAVAASATELVVTFDRNIGTVNTDGSEFTFDNGLTASAAAASGRTVTLTTSAQTIGVTYTVTVAATVLDTRGSGVSASANTATFQAFEVPAILRINEVAANITSNCDLIEARVMQTGQLGGIKVLERVSTKFTFPSMGVTAGDIIVVHFAGGSATCNPNGAVDETTAKDAQAAADHPNNYDTAWDFYVPGTGGITKTTNVFVLKTALNGYLDVLVAHDDTAGTVAADSITAAGNAATASEWTNPTGGFDATNFRANAVADLDAATDTTGDTIQRNDDDDNNDTADWTFTAPTWGTANVGQTTP